MIGFDGRLRVFGIRHHGPGSSAALLAALDAYRPSCVLIEGPPEGDALIALASADGMRPPLAILTYHADDPGNATFYPYAEFSPEWCAMRWAVANDAAVRFIDLPLEKPAADSEERDEDEAASPRQRLQDPLAELANAAGHSDGEAWWNALVEQHRHVPDVFAAIHAAMAALREQRDANPDARESQHDLRREAYMRQQIRTELKRHTGDVAVVCGAFHAPALTEKSSATKDRDCLSGFKKASKVAACWVPWTDPRLTQESGYGAGIAAPGWYSHLWRVFTSDRNAATIDAVATWQARVAGALRDAGHPAATSSVIDATRLAVSLAAIRHHPVPGLAEMRDASLAALCHGENVLMRVIEDRLVIGSRVGEVDASVPQPPLQADLQRHQRQLRLKPESEPKETALDLRTNAGMRKSELFWRLQLIDVPWATLLDASAGRGTFREVWKLCWQPELSVKLAEAVVWGVTIATAALAAARSRTRELDDPGELAELVRSCLLANLPDAAATAIAALQELATNIQRGLPRLMVAVPPLVDILRYGTARDLPVSELRGLVDGIVVQVSAGLVYAAKGLNLDEATELHGVVREFDAAVSVLDDEAQTEQWRRGLMPLTGDANVSPRLRGGAARIGHDRGFLDVDTVEVLLSNALSPSVPFEEASAWLEGFLSSSGEVLLHDPALLACVDDWIVSQAGDVFLESLPMLRRAFASFDPTLRRRLMRNLAAGPRRESVRAQAVRDPRAEEAFARGLPLLRTILGLKEPGHE